jgi:putative Mg2+ transporter-C (MgtC) family protein
VVEAVITGVSFLGAGTIFRRSDSDHIEGLTTAASLLFVAVVGICTALGEIGTALVLTLLAWVVLRSGVWLEGHFAQPDPPSTNPSDEDG